MTTIVRKSTPADAAAIARVHVRSWQVAYRGIVGDDVLDARSVEDRERRWDAILARGDDAGPGTLVAEAAGRVIGFCSPIARSRDTGAGERTGEIAAEYVEHGRPAARAAAAMTGRAGACAGHLAAACL